MRRWGSARRASFLVAAVLGAGLVACGGGNDGDADAPATAPAVPTSASAASAPANPPGPVTLRATLTGDAEIPGPGDGAGSGSAIITLDPARTDVCYELSVSGIAPADKAHVHRGPPDQAGPVAINLDPPTEGASKGCVEVNRALVEEIVAGPGRFYVNVHNQPFPAGAVRGQLVQ